MNLTDIDLKNYTDILPNGLTVVTVEMPHIHNLELAMFVRAGLRFENEKNNGIFHFLEHMLFRGNKKFPSSALLNREFEAIGRDLRASTLSEYTHYGFNPHISQLPRAMELFADFFTEPTFPQIDLERQIILEECQEELNEQGENVDIDDQACKLLYAGDPLSWPTIGTPDTIANIDAGMLKDIFDTHYVPGNMVLCAAGPIYHEDFLPLAERYFSSLSSSGQVIAKDHFHMAEPGKGPGLLFQYDSDSQVQMQICFRGLSCNHPDYYILNLINRIFDDGFTSRLQRALREDRGLVYSVECRATSLSDIGTFDFDVTVRPEKLLQVGEILLGEIKALLATGVSDEELAHSKKRYFYDLDMDQDNPYEQIARYGFTQLYSSELSPEEEWKRIQAITPKEILRVAHNIFVREKLNLILVGPFTPEIKGQLEKEIESF